MAQTFTETIDVILTQVGSSAGSWLAEHGPNIVAILIGAWLLRRFGATILSRIISRTVRPDLYPTKIDRQKRVKTLERLSSAIVRTGVYLLAAILIIGEINPDYTTALFASAGLVTVALGFGAKDLINDFMSGIFIITENQYRVGDIVEIAGVSGTVEDVTMRTTILRDLDGNVHHVPNGVIDVTTNKTMGFSRLNEDVMLVSDDDIDRVAHIIDHQGKRLARMADYERMVKEAPHFAGVVGYGSSGIVVKIAGKVTAGDKWEVKSQLYRMLHKAFSDNDIQLASPLLVGTNPMPATRKKSRAKNI